MATKFTSLGSKLIRVALAPSTPLYTRRSSLVATFGPKNVVAVSARTLRNGLQIYQKITSTAPLQALISAQENSGELEILEIDGSIDWVVTSPRYLHSYWGDSLILNQKGSWLKLFRRPVVVSGRGITALQTLAGHVHQLRVESGQSVVVNSRSLVAYSIDSNLHNPLMPLQDIVHYKKTAPNAFIKTDAQPTETSSSSIAHWWVRLQAGFSWILKSTRTSPYVRITGPSTLYVSAPVTRTWSFKLPEFVSQLFPTGNTLENQLHVEASSIIKSIERGKQTSRNSGISGPPEAHLKIATVSDGKVNFASTKTFDK